MFPIHEHPRGKTENVKYLKLGYLNNKIKVRKHRMLNQGILAYKRICLDSNQNITEPATECNFSR
jgi:hypothetical protein